MSLIPDGGETTTTTEQTTESTETTTATTEQTQTTEETTTEDNKGYLFADGISAEGDAPEWFKKDKYTTISAQAEAYGELEKKFGSFTGSPKDGKYEVKDDEGNEVVIADSPLLQLTADWGVEQGLSNDGMNTLISKVNELAASQIEEDNASAKAELGENADKRLEDLSQWGKNNLSPDEFTQFQGLAQNAGQVAILEKMIGMAKNSKLVTAPANQPTKESVESDLKELQLATDDNGKRKMDIDPTYRAMVNKKMNEFYNKKA